MIGASPSPSSPVEELSPDRIHPSSPFRPLDWRWRLAGLLAAGEPAPRRMRPDAWVGRASQYVSRSLGDRQGRRSRGWRLDDQTIGAALGLRHGGVQWGLPAIDLMLLAGLEDGATSDRIGIDEDVVAAYAALFHDVRPLLAHPDAVLTRAIGARAYDADGGGPAVALALLAYHGGPVVLDGLLGPDLARVDDRLAALMSGTASDRVAEQFGLLVAARALPTDGREAIRLLRLFAKEASVAPVEPSPRVARAGVDLAGMFGDLAGLDPAATTRRLDVVAQSSLAKTDSASVSQGKVVANATEMPTSSMRGRVASRSLRATG